MKTTQQQLKKTLVSSLLLICMGIFGQSFTHLPAKGKESTGTIEYVKGDEASLSFYVNLPQIPEKGCILRITDEFGERLFEQRIRTRTHQQLYKISRNNLTKISFQAIGKDFRVEETFNLRFVLEEKIEVTKL